MAARHKRVPRQDIGSRPILGCARSVAPLSCRHPYARGYLVRLWIPVRPWIPRTPVDTRTPALIPFEESDRDATDDTDCRNRKLV